MNVVGELVQYMELSFKVIQVFKFLDVIKKLLRIQQQRLIYFLIQNFANLNQRHRIAVHHKKQ